MLRRPFLELMYHGGGRDQLEYVRIAVVEALRNARCTDCLEFEQLQLCESWPTRSTNVTCKILALKDVLSSVRLIFKHLTNKLNNHGS